MAEELAKLTRERFEPLVDQVFHSDLGDAGTVELRLVEVTGMGGDLPEDSHRGEPFSALFRGPLEPLLPQAIHTLRHDDLGELGLFLVPVGQGEDHIRYEAVFS